jgi:hypothetical protein
MPLTSKAEILGIDDRKVEEVFVGPWNQSVFIRVVPSEEQDLFEARMMDDGGDNAQVRLRNFRARYVCMLLCDEKGNPICTDKDEKAMGKKSAKALSIIVQAGQKLNGITAEVQEAIVKNSESTLKEDGDLNSV